MITAKTLLCCWRTRALLLWIAFAGLTCTKEELRCEVWEVTEECQPKTLWGCGYYNSDNQTFWKQVCGDARNRAATGAIDTVTNNEDKIEIIHYRRRIE